MIDLVNQSPKILNACASLNFRYSLSSSLSVNFGGFGNGSVDVLAEVTISSGLIFKAIGLSAFFKLPLPLACPFAIGASAPGAIDFVS